MHRLEDAGAPFAEARRGSDAETAGASCCDVREDVAERVLGQDHVELRGIDHELHAGVVDEHVLEPHIGIVAGEAGHDLSPES